VIFKHSEAQCGREGGRESGWKGFAGEERDSDASEEREIQMMHHKFTSQMRFIVYAYKFAQAVHTHMQEEDTEDVFVADISLVGVPHTPRYLHAIEGAKKATSCPMYISVSFV
jgi:hypothetical protein